MGSDQKATLPSSERRIVSFLSNSNQRNWTRSNEGKLDFELIEKFHQKIRLVGLDQSHEVVGNLPKLMSIELL